MNPGATSMWVEDRVTEIDPQPKEEKQYIRYTTNHSHKNTTDTATQRIRLISFSLPTAFSQMHRYKEKNKYMNIQSIFRIITPHTVMLSSEVEFDKILDKESKE